MEISQVNALVFEGIHAEMSAIRSIKRHRIYDISQLYPDQDLEQKKRQAQSGIINMEPWPFSDPDFGNVETHNGTIHYAFCNPSGFIVGTPEAYCSAMVFRQTGRWPYPMDLRNRPNIGYYKIARDLWIETDNPYDAPNWASFLAINRYTRHVKSPKTGYHYVGIRQQGDGPDLVWFHRLANGQVLVSTRDGNFRVLSVDDPDYLWVKIS